MTALGSHGRQRRDVIRAAGGIAAAVVLPPAAAQGVRYTEGVHYVRLEQRVPVAPGGFEVVEFFWYECPHCNAFEPALEAWEQQRKPADVRLRRVPVFFAEVPFAAQQRFFYALEATGLLATLHRKAFRAIHVERRRLRTPDDFRAFVGANGADAEAFTAALQSPAVQARALEARQLAAAYKIDAVPAMAVHGRWYTTGALANAQGPAGSNARMLDVVDHLLGQLRKPRA